MKKIEGRKKRLAINTASSLFKQIVSTICGFILPRLFLLYYGSEVNGLVSSIAQFISLISVFDGGMGVVIEASLYKPLAEKDTKQLSKVMSSAQKFYNNFVKILFVYIIIIAIAYPYIVKSEFDYLYTLTLVIAISISSFGQYCFGVTNSVLLSADQKGYHNFNAYTITILLNTIIGVILIKCNCSVQIVKLASSCVFLLRPLYLFWHVRRKYNINWKEPYDEEPIKQKWNGVAQHIASLVVSNTDVIVLTVFSSLANVSIYSVYYLVISSIRDLINSASAGIKSLIGDMIARREFDLLNTSFNKLEWISHTIIVSLFGLTAGLIVPFVLIYTSGINDANYSVPGFALILSIAYLVYCLRIPYTAVINAAGMFKETQNSAIIEAVINIIVSVICVSRFGLIGVAVGTLLAMSYRLLYFVHFLRHHIMNRKYDLFAKQLAVDIIMFTIIYISYRLLNFSECSNFIQWVFCAVKFGLLSLAEIFVVNYITFPSHIRHVLNKFIKH